MVSVILLLEPVNSEEKETHICHHENSFRVPMSPQAAVTMIISSLDLFEAKVNVCGFDWATSSIGDNMRMLALGAEGHPGSEDEMDFKEELYNFLSSLT